MFTLRLLVRSIAFAVIAVGACFAGPPTRVACIGDSITFGFGLRDRDSQSWPARLGRWAGTDYDVRNFGVSGSTLLHAADRPYVKTKQWTQALEFAPDIALIALGTNDSKHPSADSPESDGAPNNWAHHADFERDYREMISALRQKNANVKIYLCLAPPAFPGRWGINGATVRDEINPLIREVAEKEHAEFVDLYSPLQDKAVLFPDSIHPDAAGDRIMADTIFRVVFHREAPALPSSDALLFLNRRVLWLGDSITQNGEYVSFVEYYLTKLFPAEHVDFISVGLSSETVSGLSEADHPFPRPDVRERLQRALTAVNPATVVACYGMNDGIYAPPSPEREAAFQDGMFRLATAVQRIGAPLILLTPPPFDAIPIKSKTVPASSPKFGYGTPFEGYDAVLTRFSTLEKNAPATMIRSLVDLHAVVNLELQRRRSQSPEFSFAKDGVHPSPLGHLIMARAILEALEITPPFDDAEQELARLQKDELFLAVKARREKRSAGWLAYIGYTRDKTVKTDSIADVESAAAEADRAIRLKMSEPTGNLR